jgi:hypothetical protein
MSKGDVYRLRIRGLNRRLKSSTTKTDRAVIGRKRLVAMAENEDWLDGKIGARTSLPSNTMPSKLKLVAAEIL